MSATLIVSFVHSGLAHTETVEVATLSAAKRVKKRLLDVLPQPAHVVVLPPDENAKSRKSDD